MTSRALGFGAAAAAYERFRPGYPQELFETIQTYAAQPLRTALEIGAGTGKATRLLVANGVVVTASEPDPDMLAHLRAQVPQARTVPAALEDIEPASTHDLVLAAASLHWTRPDGRWPRIAALLRPDGVFANVGGPIRIADPGLAERVRAAHAPYLATDEVTSPGGAASISGMDWPGTELAASVLFADVAEVVVDRWLSFPRAEFLGYLSTVSAYLQLPEHDRVAAFAAISRVLPTVVETDAGLTLHLARRTGAGVSPRR